MFLGVLVVGPQNKFLGTPMAALFEILKQAGVSDAYERLKTVTRGAAVTRDDLLAVLAGLTLPDELRQRLASLCVASYVGDAARLCRRACQAVEPT